MIQIEKNPDLANAITHGGIFHASEVFATALLTRVFNNNIILCRTYNLPAEVAGPVAVYDIGGGTYGHRQKGGNGCRANGVPYSCFGLLWRDLWEMIPEIANSANPKLVSEIVDRNLVQGIDAIDNGVMPDPEYVCTPMSVSAAISGFNPTEDSSEDSDTAFLKAVDFAKIILDNTLANAISKAKTEPIVEESLGRS